MLTNIKILLGISDTSKDSLLNVLITDCTSFALDYCHLEENDGSLNGVIQLMVCERYSSLRNEGINTVSYSGISESFNQDYSDKVYKQLTSFRKVRFV